MIPEWIDCWKNYCCVTLNPSVMGDAGVHEFHYKSNIVDSLIPRPEAQCKQVTADLWPAQRCSFRSTSGSKADSLKSTPLPFLFSFFKILPTAVLTQVQQMIFDFFFLSLAFFRLVVLEEDINGSFLQLCLTAQVEKAWTKTKSAADEWIVTKLLSSFHFLFWRFF